MSGNIVQFAEIIETCGGEARVRLFRPAACSGCHGCATGEGRNEVLTARNPLHADVGQSVRIELAPRSILQAALIVFALPLVLMIGGYALGFNLARVLKLAPAPNTAGVTAGLAGLFSSSIFIWMIDRWAKKTGRFEPFITAVVSAAAAREKSVCQGSER